MKAYMREVEIGGVMVNTNFSYKCNYPMVSGNFPKKYNWRRVDYNENQEKVLFELISKGYNTIRFVYRSTMVRGCPYTYVLYC